MIEVNEYKRKMQNLLEKSVLLEAKVEDQITEAAMYKERVESMLEENRKLVTETAVLNKSVENYKQLQEALEKKVSNMEKELQTYTKVKTKSAVAEAEMHQKKVLQEISEDGVNRVKHIYDHNNMKTKGTMTQLRDVNYHLVIERNWDDERDYQMRKVPIK